MSEYKGAMVRNALLAAIGIILIVSFALFGSTVVGQLHHFPTSSQTTSPGVLTSSSSESSYSFDSTTSSNSGGASSSTSSSSESTHSSSVSGSSGSRTTITATQPISSASSSPSTQNIPPDTIAEISFSAASFAYDNYTNVVYSTSASPNSSILEINATTNEVIGEIILPNLTEVSSLIFDSLNRELYLSLNQYDSPASSSLIAINVTSDTIVMNMTGLKFGQLAIDQIHNRLFASGLFFANDTNYLSVAVINGTSNTIENKLTLFESQGMKGVGCCTLGPLLYNPITGFLYLSSGTHGFDGGFGPFLVAYDTITNTTSVGNFTNFGNYGTADFSYNPQSGVTYISNNGFASATGAYNPAFIVPGNNITVVSGSNYLSTIKVDASNQNGTLGSIVYDSLNQRIIVANATLNSEVSNDENITMINATSGAVTQVIPFQAGTINAMFVDPANGDLYVADPSAIFVLTLEN
jgi:hypothetical protein